MVMILSMLLSMVVNDILLWALVLYIDCCLGIDCLIRIMTFFTNF
jgi:hypothetical protein